MEDESEEISDDKNPENKSILSLDFIYKKLTTKQSSKIVKENLSSLNYEKIAKYKMQHMSINFLLNSIFKLKKSINNANPIMKYIKNVKPYECKINISKNKMMSNLKFCKNLSFFSLSKKNKEKKLDLSAKELNYKNAFYSRMVHSDKKKLVHSRKEKIIFIQKFVRGYLQKKIIDEEVNKIIIKKFIDKILIIQKSIRKFLYKKNSLNNLIVNIIQNERKIKSDKIVDLFSLYHFRNFYKKNLIIQNIIKQRQISITLIQNKYRGYIYKKKVKQILSKEKNVFVLNYPFNAEFVQIKIYYNMNKAYKVFDFFKCPIRKYFVVYIDKNNFNPGEYLCHIIVNGNVILDKRYKYIVDKDNILYNLIYIGDIKSKNENIIEENKNKNKKKSVKKKNKKKKKRIVEEEEENSDDFYYYCYNDNSKSTNSYSTKSFNDNNDRNNINNKKYKISIDSQSMKKEKENSIQSQQMKYNNILYELCQSVSSSKSNFSLDKKINLYSKKTHKTKFGSDKRK